MLTCWTIIMALFVGKARGSVLPGILLHESANFVAFTINYRQQYVFLFWGIASLIAAAFLPKPLIKFGNNAQAGPGQGRMSPESR
jgi:hypothetical protein